MKQIKIFILAISAVVAVMLCGINISRSTYAFVKNEYKSENNLVDAGYFIALEDDEITITIDGTTSYKTEIPAEGLRQRDRELLTKGIYADTYEDILLLLEDFNS